MNENSILQDYRRESLSSTNQTVDTPTYEEMDWAAFQQLLIQERIEVKRKKIIIDKEVIISQVLKLSGIMSVIQFKGGNLIFQGSTMDSIFDEECSIQGFQIEVYQTTPCIRVHQRNLMIMACNIENFQNQGIFIKFDNSLTINDTTMKGFQVYVGCESNRTQLSINHSIIKSDCQQQQSVLIHADNLGEFKMDITNSIIEGSSVIITNSNNVEIRIKDNEFKNQQISISIENVQNKFIIIDKNIFYLSLDYAIKMNNVEVDKLQLFKNTITKCRIGIFLQNVVEICQLIQNIKPITIKQNVLTSMEQTAIIIREVICMEIDEINIQDNTIGMDIDISTSKIPEQNNINPFIITIKNSTIGSNHIHGIFLNSNLQYHPINLQISKTAFFSNCNALNLSHQGESNDKRFKININSCQFQDNHFSNSNSNYELNIINTNIVVRKSKQFDSVINNLLLNQGQKTVKLCEYIFNSFYFNSIYIIIKTSQNERSSVQELLQILYSIIKKQFQSNLKNKIKFLQNNFIICQYILKTNFSIQIGRYGWSYIQLNKYFLFCYLKEGIYPINQLKSELNNQIIQYYTIEELITTLTKIANSIIIEKMAYKNMNRHLRISTYSLRAYIFHITIVIKIDFLSIIKSYQDFHFQDQFILLENLVQFGKTQENHFCQEHQVLNLNFTINA